MQPGMRIGQYVLIEQIGQGGQATVWSAEDVQLKRTVAIKTINLTTQVQPGVLASSSPATSPVALEEQVRRFRAEAEIIADLEHPFILPVYGFGQQEDWLYIVMRYMPGGTLKKLVQSGKLSLEEVVKIAEPIADALDLAHIRHIVHRDIKSVNILLDAQKRPYLADFGLSVTQGDAGATSGSGTLAYMAPEQLKGASFDHRSDIYSFGILLYEMFTGTPPQFNNQHWNLTQMLSGAELPHSFDIPEAVFDVLRRATAVDPADRYDTAAEIVRDLKDIQQRRPEFTEDDILLPINDPALQASIDAHNLFDAALAKWADGAGRFRLYEEDFQYVDSFYSDNDNWGFELDDASRRMMLRAALEHGYHLDLWWDRTENVADKRAVALQTLTSELPSARLRAIEKLTALEDSTPPAIPTRVATIIEFDPDADVQLAGVKLLEARAQRSASGSWREYAYSAEIDNMLASLAAKDADANVSEAAARAISRLRAEKPLKRIAAATSDPDAGVADRALQSLIDARDEAPALPTSIPADLRRRAFVALTMRQLLAGNFLLRFIGAMLGFVIGWVGIALAVFTDQFTASALTDNTLLLAAIGNAVVTGLFWGAIFAIPFTVTIEIAQRLKVWTPLGRSVLAILIGTVLFVLGFWLLRLLNYNLPDAPKWDYLIGLCGLIAAGFAFPTGFRLPDWARALIGAVAVFVALYLSYSYQSQVFIDWSLIYLPMGSEVRLATAFAAGIGVLVHLPEWMPGLRRAFRRRGRK
ncbi:MAG: protein kinase [Anaerolineae bacterium]